VVDLSSYFDGHEISPRQACFGVPVLSYFVLFWMPTLVLDSTAELEVYSLITFIGPSEMNAELLKALLTLASLIVALYMSLKPNRKKSLEM
jgi:hypothetical protein